MWESPSEIYSVKTDSQWALPLGNRRTLRGTMELIIFCQVDVRSKWMAQHWDLRDEKRLNPAGRHFQERLKSEERGCPHFLAAMKNLLCHLFQSLYRVWKSRNRTNRGYPVNPLSSSVKSKPFPCPVVLSSSSSAQSPSSHEKGQIVPELLCKWSIWRRGSFWPSCKLISLRK